MTTVMDPSAVITVGKGRRGAEQPSRLSITLADLITAIQDVVGPEDDKLVVATVRHLLRAGRLTRLRSGTRWDPPSLWEKVLSHMLKGGVRYPTVGAG